MSSSLCTVACNSKYYFPVQPPFFSFPPTLNTPISSSPLTAPPYSWSVQHPSPHSILTLSPTLLNMYTSQIHSVQSSLQPTYSLPHAPYPPLIAQTASYAISKSITNLKEVISKKVNEKRIYLTEHALKRLRERGINTDDIFYILKMGSHDGSIWDKETENWRYAIKGVTLKGTCLRVIVFFSAGYLSIATAYEIRKFGPSPLLTDFSKKLREPVFNVKQVVKKKTDDKQVEFTEQLLGELIELGITTENVLDILKNGSHDGSYKNHADGGWLYAIRGWTDKGIRLRTTVRFKANKLIIMAVHKDSKTRKAGHS